MADQIAPRKRSKLDSDTSKDVATSATTELEEAVEAPIAKPQSINSTPEIVELLKSKREWDAEFLTDMAAYTKTCDKMSENSEDYDTAKMPDGRPCRLLFPPGRERIKTLKGRWPCVGFIGYRPPETQRKENDESLVDEINKIDIGIVDNLNPDLVYGYITCKQAVDSEDYGNLVIMAHPDVPDIFRRTPKHDDALSISAKYYDHLRIHRCFITFHEGQEKPSIEFIRTLYNKYEEGNRSSHSIIYW